MAEKGLDINGKRSSVRQLHAESLEDAQSLQYRFGWAGSVKLKQHLSKVGCQKSSKILGLRGLNVGISDSFGLGDFSEPIEEDRLSHPSQTDRHQALAWLAC